MLFSQITETLMYPIKLKATLSTLHSEIISYAIENYQKKLSFKKDIIKTLNTISYIIVKGDSIPASWTSSKPFKNLEFVDNSTCEYVLGRLYIPYDEIKWDIEEVDSSPISTSIPEIKENKSEKQEAPTPKEDLYLRPPVFPQFDVTKPWLNVNKDGEQYTIYTSMPVIPKTQSQISVTTNAELMTKTDLLHLFPNQLIHTRASVMYDPCAKLEFDNRLGVILPIDRFTADQIRDNTIKYPHFYKLKRILNGQLVSFYSNIEIGGELLDTLEIWDSLPESKTIPKTSEFIKEYVVRRYLLERDILGIEHRFPLFGTLDPFLTLFSTPGDYRLFGYADPTELAKKCVLSRVSYKQSRNPIIRKVMDLP